MQPLTPFVSTAFCIVLSAAMSSACRGGAPAQGAASAPPPAGVKLMSLKTSPIEDASEFIATLRSRSSTTVQPEVEGQITRIFVKSGDKVKVGAPLVQINPARQQAAVLSTEASRTGVEADVAYWQQQVKRLASLVEAGAISKAEFDQAQTSMQQAEARLGALAAQVKEGRVALEFHRVEAPQAGTVGDIPVRVGDRVTTSTIITTIDENELIEAYVQVPLGRSPELKLGLPVQLLSADGKILASNPITFVAPRVDDATQTVLVKSRLKQEPPSVRLQQFIRSRIVWRTAPGLTIPLTAVVRISGQYFCFVAEPGPQGSLVARQRPIEVGEVLGNDYVVRSGLKEGDQLIVSGIQKVGDGAPVRGV
jgi:RND family efflux transporter MFP subunit